MSSCLFSHTQEERSNEASRKKKKIKLQNNSDKQARTVN